MVWIMLACGLYLALAGLLNNGCDGLEYLHEAILAAVPPSVAATYYSDMFKDPQAGKLIGNVVAAGQFCHSGVFPEASIYDPFLLEINSTKPTVDFLRKIEYHIAKDIGTFFTNEAMPEYDKFMHEYNDTLTGQGSKGKSHASSSSIIQKVASEIRGPGAKYTAEATKDLGLETFNSNAFYGCLVSNGSASPETLLDKYLSDANVDAGRFVQDFTSMASSRKSHGYIKLVIGAFSSIAQELYSVSDEITRNGTNASATFGCLESVVPTPIAGDLSDVVRGLGDAFAVVGDTSPHIVSNTCVGALTMYNTLVNTVCKDDHSPRVELRAAADWVYALFAVVGFFVCSSTIAHHIIPLQKRFYPSPFKGCHRHFAFPASWRAHARLGVRHQRHGSYAVALSIALQQLKERDHDVAERTGLEEALWLLRASTTTKITKKESLTIDVFLGILEHALDVLSVSYEPHDFQQRGSKCCTKSEGDPMGLSHELAAVSQNAAKCNSSGDDATKQRSEDILELLHRCAVQKKIGQERSSLHWDEDTLAQKATKIGELPVLLLMMPFQAIQIIYWFGDASEIMQRYFSLAASNLDYGSITALYGVLISAACIDIVASFVTFAGVQNYIDDAWGKRLFMGGLFLFAATVVLHLTSFIIAVVGLCLSFGAEDTMQAVQWMAVLLSVAIASAFHGSAECTILVYAAYCWGWRHQTIQDNSNIKVGDLLRGDSQSLLGESVLESGWTKPNKPQHWYEWKLGNVTDALERVRDEDKKRKEIELKDVTEVKDGNSDDENSDDDSDLEYKD